MVIQIQYIFAKLGPLTFCLGSALQSVYLQIIWFWTLQYRTPSHQVNTVTATN